MGQTFNIDGKHLTLEQAQEYYAQNRADTVVSVPVSEIDTVDTDIDALKAELDALGIKYHWNAGKDKLQSLLNK